MKIYDMIEGKWLKTTEKNKKKEQELKDYEDFGIRTLLVTYDEEKEWIQEEKSYTESRKKLDK
jgi:hypothetical protein